MSNLVTNSNVTNSVGVTMNEDATQKAAKTPRKPRTPKGTPQTSTKTTKTVSKKDAKKEAGAKKLSNKTAAQLKQDAKKANEQKAKTRKKDALTGLKDANKEQGTLSACMGIINLLWDKGYNTAFGYLGYKQEDMTVPAMIKLFKEYVTDKKNNFLYPVRKPMWKTENGKTTPVLNMQKKQRHETVLVPFAEKFTPKKVWQTLEYIQIKRGIIKL